MLIGILMIYICLEMFMNVILLMLLSIFQDIGVLEIITCSATHGYFPILYVNEKNC